MTESIWDGDDDGIGDTDLVKRLRKQINDQAKQIKDLADERDKYRNTARTSGVTDALRSLGVKKTAIAKFIPDDVEPTEAAIKEWLVENGELFGIDLNAGAEEQPLQQQAQKPATEGYSAEQVAELKKIQDITPSSSTSGASSEDQLLTGLKAAFDQSTSFADFWSKAENSLSRPS
jgi:hypothetical protein